MICFIALISYLCNPLEILNIHNIAVENAFNLWLAISLLITTFIIYVGVDKIISQRRLAIILKIICLISYVMLTWYIDYTLLILFTPYLPRVFDNVEYIMDGWTYHFLAYLYFAIPACCLLLLFFVISRSLHSRLTTFSTLIISKVFVFFGLLQWLALLYWTLISKSP